MTEKQDLPEWIKQHVTMEGWEVDDEKVPHALFRMRDLIVVRVSIRAEVFVSQSMDWVDIGQFRTLRPAFAHAEAIAKPILEAQKALLEGERE